MDIRVCIMAGGKGERFWPYSRATRPKQLLPIVGEEPLLTATVRRNRAIADDASQYIVTTQQQADMVASAALDIPRENVIAEPFGRNTAPCVGLMCALCAAENPEIVLVVIPADHCIPDDDAYANTIRAAAEMAVKKEALVTLGIKPKGPETGYGYIRAGELCGTANGIEFAHVKKFIEKPEKAAAEQLIADGDAYWNAGMFVFRVADMCAAFAEHMPAFYSGMQKITAAAKEGNAKEVIEEVYRDAESISIDYAIMEKASNVLVAQTGFVWDDVGSWTAAAEHWKTDENGNAQQGDSLCLESDGCIIGNDSKGVVGVIGMKDVIVVRTGDAVLVCPKNRAQDVKKIVQTLRADDTHRKFVD